MFSPSNPYFFSMAFSKSRLGAFQIFFFHFIYDMRKLILLLLLAGTALSFPSCSGSLPVPDASHADWASRRWNWVTMEDLVSGRRLYVDKCSGCHGLRQPAKYSETEWLKIMGEMKSRAGVKEAETSQILVYLIAAGEVDRQNSKP